MSIFDEKYLPDLAQAESAVKKLKSQGCGIILTTGVFDGLHPGHTRYLAAAKNLYPQAKLIVGVNDDPFVRQLKGPSRPLFPDISRAEVLTNLIWVDFAVIFHDRLEIVQAVKPNIMVMSSTSHCKPEDSPRQAQRQLVEAWGGKVVILGEMYERHTSDISFFKLKEAAS